MKFVYSFLRVILVFLFLGPLAGTIFIGGTQNLSLSQIGQISLYGYLFGFIPALISGFVNWIVILIFYLFRNDDYFWPGVFLGSGTPNIMFHMAYAHGDFSWFFFWVCLFATVICALLSSHQAWSYLYKS